MTKQKQKQKERSLKELYDVTDEILEAQMTPVLEGNYRIEGPVDQTDCIEKEMSSHRLVKKFSSRSASGSSSMRTESGLCNVCAVPCSSCRHFNQAVSCMEVKAENEFSDETSRVNVTTTGSFNNENVVPSFKKRARTDRKPTASETSNIVSTSSSHDSIAENGDSKEALRNSKEIEMLPNASSGLAVAHGQLLSEPQRTTGQSGNVSSTCDVAIYMHQTALANHEIETIGNDDEISCVSGINDAPASANRKDNCNNSRASLFSKDQLISSSNECILQISDPSEFPASKDCIAENSQNMTSSFHSEGAKSFSSNGGSKKENVCSHNQVESSVCPVPFVESVSEKLEISTGVLSSDSHKIVDESKFENSKRSLAMTEILIGDDTCLGAGSVGKTEEPAAHSIEHLEINEQNDKSSVSILKNQDPPLTSQPDDGSNGSDVLEVDVKVCDICGDTGREHLLAICSRCSDGAEHTYCMRILMNKVPECDWLCEVCQMQEDTANHKKYKSENVLGALNVSDLSGKNKISVGTFDSMIAPSPRLSSKRHSDNLEIPSAAKRQALESCAGPQKPSSPNKVYTLSRERSFKNVDKGKVKPVHPIPSLGGASSQGTAHSPMVAIQKPSKIQPLHQSPRCSLSKSSSFNTPKVKLVQDVPQNKKSGKLPSTSGTRKEDLVRTITKSSSFKIGSSHTGSSESEAKLYSPNILQGEDSRGVQLGKNKKMIERKDSFKSDCMVSPRAGFTLSSPKDGQKVSSRGEILQLPSSTRRSHDPKVVQADERLSAPSNLTSPLPHRRSETPNPLAGRGNFKRQSSLASRSDAYPTFKRNSAEQKTSLVNPNDEIATNLSCTPDGPRSSHGLVSHDDLPESRKPMDQDKIIEETSCSQSRQSVSVAGKIIRCSNCKEIGHAAQFCPNGSMRIVLESTPARNSRQVINSSTKLNDAKEATAATNKALQLHEGVVCALKEVDLNAPFVSLDRNQLRPSLCDLQNRDSSVSVRSNISSFPAPDYIWQGEFAVQSSNGRHLGSFDGIQAHLSTTASPKVIEAVNKLSDSVQLEEISRPSTWPTQFQNGVAEDNIALYFFPQDAERNYHKLVESMMKNDLALRGIIDGVELLIFPSNQLCENAKCWNMLYYLWGVFRAKRRNSSEKIDMTSMVIQGRKTDEAFPSDSSSGHESMTEKYPSQTLDMGSSFSNKEQRLEGTYYSKHVSEGVTTTERYFFPVEAGPIKDLVAKGGSMPVQVVSLKNEDQLLSGCPNLDLALGGEKKSPKQKIEPLFELLVKKNNDHVHGKRPEHMAVNCEDDSLSSLTLSLAVPSCSEMVQPVANPEPERSHSDTSLLLFGGFPRI